MAQSLAKARPVFSQATWEIMHTALSYISHHGICSNDENNCPACIARKALGQVNEETGDAQ